jgi:hypothetical protein
LYLRWSTNTVLILGLFSAKAKNPREGDTGKVRAACLVKYHSLLAVKIGPDNCLREIVHWISDKVKKPSENLGIKNLLWFIIKLYLLQFKKIIKKEDLEEQPNFYVERISDGVLLQS